MTLRFSEAGYKRIMAAYHRRPAWQQWLLLPWLFPVEALTCWPVPICLGLAALILAHLKLAYLRESLSWTAIGLLSTAPVWGPVGFGYAMVLWVIVGMIPYSAILCWRRYRAGQPLTGRDPALALPDDTWARLCQGKLLTHEDLVVCWNRSRLVDDRSILCCKIFGITTIVALICELVAWLARGDKYNGVFAGIVFLCFSTLWPAASFYDPRLYLACNACGQRIFGLNLQRLIETRTCPHCSSPAQVTSRQPGRTSGTLWDAEVP